MSRWPLPILLLSALLLPLPAAAATAIAPHQVRMVMELDGPLQPGEFAWDESGAPPGPVQVVVDLAVERIYVYRGGVEIGRAFILYGADDKPTPTGIFPILEKDADHYSNLYDNAPMPWMLRLTWDGVAIHGTEVDAGYATHGCVGVPDDFAELLFAAARKGDAVLVTHGWMPQIYGN